LSSGRSSDDEHEEQQAVLAARDRQSKVFTSGSLV